MEKNIKVKMESGLEPRLAALFVQIASKFNSNIYTRIAEKKVNAKSIMGIMSLAIENGQEIIIEAEGEDEEDAINELTKFLSNNV